MEDLIKLLHTDNHSLEIADGEVCTFDDRMIAVVMDKIVVPEGLYKDEAICYITDRYHTSPQNYTLHLSSIGYEKKYYSSFASTQIM